MLFAEVHLSVRPLAPADGHMDSHSRPRTERRRKSGKSLGPGPPFGKTYLKFSLGWRSVCQSDLQAAFLKGAAGKGPPLKVAKRFSQEETGGEGSPGANGMACRITHARQSLANLLHWELESRMVRALQPRTRSLCNAVTQTTVGLSAAASGCASLGNFMTEFSLAVGRSGTPSMPYRAVRGWEAVLSTSRGRSTYFR